MTRAAPVQTRRKLLSGAGKGAVFWAASKSVAKSLPSSAPWSVSSEGYTFIWDVESDQAIVRPEHVETPIWTGGLLPGFLLAAPDKTLAYVKANVDLKNSSMGSTGGKLALRADSLASCELVFEAKDYGLNFTHFHIDWTSGPLPIIGLYFGTAPLSAGEKLAAPTLDQSFWPNWDSACFCVPGAKGAPVQSVFRRWDLGSANLPLGSFGPALGTPYAAAYPRPLYAAAMGNQDGWVCLGTGAPMDGALSLTLESSSACLHVLYREDLWGAPEPKRRVWQAPLRVTWARDPWRAYQKMFNSFDSRRIVRSAPLKPQWNSWGDFKKNIYDLRALADWTASMDAKILGLDDRWETFVGSGEPDRKRFPQFDEDISYIKTQGLDIGFWQPVGWVDQPEEVGLSERDLIVGTDGHPRRVAWDTNPRSRSHYCLDPSSPNAVQFLRRRTINLMTKYRPVLLKLDFGYGLPSPNVGVPRDPSLRGERYSLRLLKIIAEAARSINQDVAIEYYSLHPLVRAIADVIALDDLGDAGNEEARGHSQWSIWSALGGGKSNIMASSGYDWNADAEVVLNSAVIGVPGAVLSRTMEDGSPVPSRFVNRRMALNRWYRRRTDWSPLWLNSSPGGYMQDPLMRCFGRLENIDGENRLTALVLRENEKHLLPKNCLDGMTWQGSWAVIAQDDHDVFMSRRLACLPIDGTDLRIPRPSRPDRVLAVSRSSEAAWSDWTWAGGKVNLHAKSSSDQFLGFLIVA
jgi:hypothetical protein